jgi:hypothetical protein
MEEHSSSSFLAHLSNGVRDEVKAFILFLFRGEGIKGEIGNVVEWYEWRSGEWRGWWHAVLVLLVESCEAGGGGWWWNRE